MKLKKHGALLSLVAVVLLAFGLRVYELGLQSYWIDEMVSLYFTTRDKWNDIFLDNHPILYHVLLKLWIKLWGTSEVATRFLSVIFSTATTVVMFFLGQKVLKNKWWGLGVAFLYAISGFAIVYAQETRMYAIFELGAAVNYYFFYELYFEKNKSKKTLYGFTASCLFLAATHYGALLIIAYEALWILKNKKLFKIIFPALIAGAALLVVSYLRNFAWFGLDWQKLKYVQEPTARTPLEGLVYLSNLSIFNFYLYLIFFSLTFWEIRKEGPKKAVYFWMGGLIGGSVGLLFLASWITERSLMLPRYFIYLNPLWILLFAFGLWNMGKKARAWGALTVVIALLWLPKAYLNVKSPWREAADKISEDKPLPQVFTTRTLAVGVPYLEKHGIYVERITLDQTKEPALVAQRFAKNRPVWILENYWGGKAYLEDFLKGIKAEGYNIEEFTVQNPLSEPLSLVRITP